MCETKRDLSILSINVKTSNSENLIDLSKDLKIDMDNINKAFCDQPAKFAWWATVTAQAKTLVDRKKLEIAKQEEYLKKTLVGELDAIVRTNLELNGEKVTETKVSNSIYSHELYLQTQEELHKLREELLELQQNLSVLEIARDAMIQRKDMLISLGAQIRNETSNSELCLKKATAKKIVNKYKNTEM